MRRKLTAKVAKRYTTGWGPERRTFVRFLFSDGAEVDVCTIGPTMLASIAEAMARAFELHAEGKRYGSVEL